MSKRRAGAPGPSTARNPPKPARLVRMADYEATRESDRWNSGPPGDVGDERSRGIPRQQLGETQKDKAQKEGEWSGENKNQQNEKDIKTGENKKV